MSISEIYGEFSKFKRASFDSLNTNHPRMWKDAACSYHVCYRSTSEGNFAPFNFCSHANFKHRKWVELKARSLILVYNTFSHNTDIC